MMRPQWPLLTIVGAPDSLHSQVCGTLGEPSPRPLARSSTAAAKNRTSSNLVAELPGLG